MAVRDGTPLNVGRKTRAIPPALRRALRTRDRGCCFPGCGERRFVDAHHIHHWAHGGETKLSNLLLLCRHHHRLVHEGGFTVERGPAAMPIFRRPNGRAISPSPRATRRDLAAAEHVLPRDPEIGPTTCTARSGGDRLNHADAVDGLLQSAGLLHHPLPHQRGRGPAEPREGATEQSGTPPSAPSS